MIIEEITYKINGCAMKAHNILGNGFQSDCRCGMLNAIKMDSFSHHQTQIKSHNFKETLAAIDNKIKAYSE
jgi:hypothetical protein